MSSQTQTSNRKKITGEVVFLKTLASGWSHGSISVNGKRLSVKGNALTGLREKSTYEFGGELMHDPKWGDSFRVDVVHPYVPTTKAAIEKYLSKNYSNVGEKTANKFVEAQLATGMTIEQLREFILQNPFTIDFSNVTKRKTQTKEKGGVKGAIYRHFSTKLGGGDGLDAIFRSLAGYYEKKLEGYTDPVGASWQYFTQNPFSAIRDLKGYGFLRADVFGKKLGFPNNAKCRIAALATYAIDEGCNTSGHTYLRIEDFTAKIHSFDWQVEAVDAIAAAKEMGEPIVEEGGRYYLRKLYMAEKFCADNLAERYKAAPTPLLDKPAQEIEEVVQKACNAIGITLDDSQHKAVIGILKSGRTIHSLTAAPGSGKTFLVEVILSVLGKSLEVAAVAPTGKASKVLSKRVSRYGVKATTIHSMLGVGEKGGFKYNSTNKLPFDLLICDEVSMVDISLLHGIMSALKPETHVIFLGDANQLPSVGPGDVLRNLLDLRFDHHRLNQTHRNDGGILEVVNLAGAGRADFTKERHDVDFHDGLPEPTLENIGSVLEKYDAELHAEGGDFTAVGLLIARRKGDILVPGWNTTYLNHVMRNRYNPDGQKVPGTLFREGDRIIIRKNLTLKQPDIKGEASEPETVVNGDVGFIRGFTKKTAQSDIDDDESIASVGSVSTLLIELDDGRELSFPISNLDALTLGYALTVHAAQGSEYTRLITIVVNGAANFMHRGILFTAFSRAQEKLTIIGDISAIQNILKRVAPIRQSHLVKRVQGLTAHLERNHWLDDAQEFETVDF